MRTERRNVVMRRTSIFSASSQPNILAEYIFLVFRSERPRGIAVIRIYSRDYTGTLNLGGTEGRANLSLLEKFTCLRRQKMGREERKHGFRLDTLERWLMYRVQFRGKKRNPGKGNDTCEAYGKAGTEEVQEL